MRRRSEAGGEGNSVQLDTVLDDGSSVPLRSPGRQCGGP